MLGGDGDRLPPPKSRRGGTVERIGPNKRADIGESSGFN